LKRAGGWDGWRTRPEGLAYQAGKPAEAGWERGRLFIFFFKCVAALLRRGRGGREGGEGLERRAVAPKLSQRGSESGDEGGAFFGG